MKHRRWLWILVLPLMGCADAPAVPRGTDSDLSDEQSRASATGSSGSWTRSNTPRGDPFVDAFTEFEASVPGNVGIAVTAVGSSTAPTVTGHLQSGAAWSTVKVPLAIAARHLEGAAPLIRHAIQYSDNEAAESLWSGLGDPAHAAAKVDAVLESHQDTRTRTQSRRLRVGLTAYGQTEWSLSDQAQFASTLPCAADSTEVYRLMGQISNEQSWGLGVIDGARFKGGWGPSVEGGYLVRQFGVIPTDRGLVTVAVAVRPASGSLESGTAALTQVAHWLSTHASLLPAGRC